MDMLSVYNLNPRTQVQHTLSYLNDIFLVFTAKQKQKRKAQASNINYALLNNFHGKLHLGVYEFLYLQLQV